MMRAWQRAERILAIRLDSVGDVLMTEPALAALRSSGRRHVTLLTSDSGSHVGRLLPSVDEVITYSAPWMKATARRDAGLDLMMIERLRAGRYDGAVIFTVRTQSPLPAALMAYLAGIPLRAAHCRENPYQLLSDWIAEDEPGVERHEVERQLQLVRELGFVARRDRIALRIRPAHRSRALVRLRAAGLRPEQPWLVIHPGATAPSRRWPAERFAAVADRLAMEDGWQVVVLGGPGDREEVSVLRSSMRADHVAPQGLSLAELAASIGMAQLFIGNNSGPMHIAAAVGTPSVVLYAQTNLQHTPWKGASRVLTREVPCRNCLKSTCPLGHHACLRLIEPDEVVDAARSLLMPLIRAAGAPA
jgi:lipopolysaccharide heptosyltransferase II